MKASVDLASVEKSTFEPLIGTSFTVASETSGESLELKLSEISEYPDYRPQDREGRRVPFALVFECPSRILDAGTYRLEQEGLEPLEVFLSPFSGFETGCKLEAIFN